MSDLDNMIVAGRECIGAFYKYWDGSAPIEAWEGGYRDAPGLTAEYVIAHGVYCSGYINAMQELAGVNYGRGGTLYYGQIMSPWEEFDPSKWYPVGTILVEPFIAGTSEGHIAMVSRPNQLVLQSETLNGANEYKTAAIQHAYMPWAWAGWIPGVPAADGLPGWSEAGGGVEGYPGDWAAPKDAAAWMARVAENIYGLPGILPVMTSCVELTQAWTGPGDVKQVPGYLGAVDYDSLGYFQQRPSQGWGTPEQIVNPEYALSRFLDEALRQAPVTYPTDSEGLGEWCQAVQNSAVPGAYASKGYDLARELLGDSEAGDDTKKETWEVYGWYQVEESGILTPQGKAKR